MAVIKLLNDHPDYAPILAFWSYMEWYRNRPIEFDIVLKFYQIRKNDKTLPISWVSIEDGIPVGMISLKENDLWSRMDLKPWLSSLYVLPEFRNLGIGTLLIKSVIDKSRELGYSRLYLFTAQSKEYQLDNFYIRKGWRFFDNAIDNDGMETKIFIYFTKN